DGSAVPHFYSKETGAFAIAAANVTGEITVTAEAEETGHDLHYIYQVPVLGVLVQNTYTEDYQAGEPVDLTWANEYAEKANSDPELKQEGYTFRWDWATADGQPLHVMPPQDWWVTGTYVPNVHRLIINYVYEGTGAMAAPSHVEDLNYGSTYSVTSPLIDGYLADTVTVSGTVNSENAAMDGETGILTITVTYAATANQLTIIYLKGDTNEEVGRYSASVDTNASYNVVTADQVDAALVTGYSPDRDVISGTMVPEGETYYVTFQPNTYTVTLDAAGGTVQPAERKAVYNQVYMWNGTGYSALPTPVKVGAVFEGWYLGDTKITDSTVVSAASDHTLIARWTELQYKLVIRYVNEDGVSMVTIDPDAPDYEGLYTAGSSYSVTSPEVDQPSAGYYSPSQTEVSGTMAAQNTLVTVVYVKNYHTLTIQYLYADNVDDTSLHGHAAADPYSAELLQGTDYEVVTADWFEDQGKADLLTQYTASHETVTGTMGSSDVLVNVYLYDKEIRISVTITWSDLTFVHDSGVWDPETHRYSEEPIEAAAPDSNMITVANDSDIGMGVSFSYEAAEGYEGLDAFFTHQNYATGTELTELSLDKLEAQSVWLWLRGKMPEDAEGTVVTGTCTVTIRGGG
ncbi:MAG: InlB B-repeat-containing protein, partial [Firmicutes bacterium]|nr:InlB B-repeat-containing protein [Bacillota bacterium]